VRGETLALAVGAVGLAALIVTAVGLYQTPIYEASAKVFVDWRFEQCSRQICPIPNPPTAPTLQLAQKVVPIGSVAKEAIRGLNLGMSPDDLLNNLTVQRNVPFIQLSYTSGDPARAEEVVGTVGRLYAERITKADPDQLPADTDLTAAVWDVKASHEPVSPKPLRNGLITLVGGLALVLAWAFVRGALRNSRGI
jgi:capsular polysaccharide biosynthesis protein